MPDNKEKKYTVDDILQEYDEINDVPETPAVEPPTDDELFVAKMSYDAPELFDESEITENDDDYDEAAEEEIFEEEIPEAEDIDISEEILEEVEPVIEAEELPPTVEEMILAEAATWDDSVMVEGFDVLPSEEITSEKQLSEETVEIEEVSEEISETEEASEEISENDEKEETTEESDDKDSLQTKENTEILSENAETEGNISENKEVSESSQTETDVNDSFLKKFFKGLLPWKGDGIGEIIRKIIFLLAMIVFIGAGVMLISTLMQSEQAVEEKQENQSIITTTVATTVDSEGNVITIAPTEEEIAEHNFNVAEHFKNINEDYIGYLEVSGCDIAEPIMQCEDNDYYLTHTYYGGTNKAGTVFLDYRCTVSEEYISPNLVFYGHNQEDGTMFGNLKDYKNDVDFYAENPLVKFSPEFETGEYVIYGYFVTHTRPDQDSRGEVFHYQDYIEVLSDEATFDWYVKEIQERNQIVSPVDVQFGDKLLCLSTCSNEFSDSRFVVFARRLREDESIEDFDFTEAYLNPNAKGLDWDAITSDEVSTTTVEETTETESETSSEAETTTAPAEEEKPKKTTSDTRRNYHDYMKDKKTTVTTTEETTVPEESSVEGGESADSVSGEETPAETAVPESTAEGEETATVPSM